MQTYVIKTLIACGTVLTLISLITHSVECTINLFQTSMNVPLILAFMTGNVLTRSICLSVHASLDLLEHCVKLVSTNRII